MPVAKLLQSASKDGKLYRRDTAITELNSWLNSAASIQAQETMI